MTPTWTLVLKYSDPARHPTTVHGYASREDAQMAGQQASFMEQIRPQNGAQQTAMQGMVIDIPPHAVIAFDVFAGPTLP